MIIQHNLQALNAVYNLKKNDYGMGKAIEKLSSGLRINSAADDAAGLAISEKMRSQIRGMEMAKRNAADGISLIQTAEGAMSSMHSILQRMNELCVQAANGTYSDDDREKISLELSSLADEIDTEVENTQYNNMNLFMGPNAPITFQIGANQGQVLDLTIDKTNLPQSMALFGSAYLFGNVHVDLSDPANAGIVLDNVKGYIDSVSTERSNLGAVQNRLEHTINCLGVYSENLTAAESRIRDMDMASGMMEFVKYQILNQSTSAMLAQANQVPQGVLSLLR